MIAKTRLNISQQQLIDFCRRHHIRKLSLFGSALRSDFSPTSDLDILVEFDPDHIPGLAFFGMQQELSELLNRPVDFNTPQFLSPTFRQYVLAQAEVLYDANGDVGSPISHQQTQLQSDVL